LRDPDVAPQGNPLPLLFWPRLFDVCFAQLFRSAQYLNGKPDISRLPLILRKKVELSVGLVIRTPRGTISWRGRELTLE
jgi:hypothetical protein